VPTSFLLIAGMSGVGCMFGRNAWVDFGKWNIYPNLSVLFVGPSGCGKDTVINFVETFHDDCGGVNRVAGRTIEEIFNQLEKSGDPAVAFMPMKELAANLGTKDYQGGIITNLTDLLSTGEYVDISTKTGGKKHIRRPTITMQAASTPAWLHTQMPDGTLEGGFFPRCIVVCESYNTRKFVPNPKHEVTKLEWQDIVRSRQGFVAGVSAVLRRFRDQPREVIMLEDAYLYYTNWYHNRNSYFSPTVRPYAHRARDQIVRLGLISALLRNRAYIDESDMRFAAAIMQHVATSIDRAVVPPSRDALIADEIFSLLPASAQTIFRTCGMRHGRNAVLNAIGLLTDSGQIKKDPGGLYIRS
jgi:energy-coupling factor transporter ATP-binding protein EcfA2